MSKLLEQINTNLLNKDYLDNLDYIKNFFVDKSILVIGGAGSIGSEVVKNLCTFSAKKIDVLDINENSSVELIRDINCGHKFVLRPNIFILDVNSYSFEYLMDENRYDYVLNFSATKHVRSENNSFNSMKIIQTNVLNTQLIINCCKNYNIKKLFSVSTDKASSPINIMGASKKLMELLLQQNDKLLSSSARFANVSFSTGSILESVIKRISKMQPIGAPSDIKRYFISHNDAARLCILSLVFSENNDIYFSKLEPSRDLVNIKDLIIEILYSKGFEPDICSSEYEALEKSKSLNKNSKEWPCIFSPSKTTGEKYYEEFFNIDDEIDNNKFKNIGVIKTKKSNINGIEIMHELLDMQKSKYSKNDIISFLNKYLKDFNHQDTKQSLNQVI